MPTPSPHNPLDQAQFEALFKSHFQYLCNFARQYVGEDEVAEDLTQKVFITLWEKRDTIDPKLSVKSYLFTMLKNRCLNYLRDSKKYHSKVLDIDCGNLEISVEEDPLAEEELRKQIQAALDELPEKCRLVFEMSRFRGMKYKEIAEDLELSQKTVEAHMSKAIKSLRKSLSQWLGLLLLLIIILYQKT